jgi:hypothetical protein
MPHPYIPLQGLDESTRIALSTPDASQTIAAKHATLGDWIALGSLLAFTASFWSGMLFFLGFYLPSNSPSPSWEIFHTFLGVFWLTTLILGLSLLIPVLAEYLFHKKSQTQPSMKN